MQIAAMAHTSLNLLHGYDGHKPAAIERQVAPAAVILVAVGHWQKVQSVLEAAGIHEAGAKRTGALIKAQSW